MGVWLSGFKLRGYFYIFLNISFLLVLCSFIVVQFRASGSVVLRKFDFPASPSHHSCKGFEKLENKQTKCLYLKSHKNPCTPQGYIDYLYLFYCTFGELPIFCYSLLFLWLLVLFYLLGNTASEYFCSSLESLSKLLKLSPAIAGVTLLSLGNGAPDVFASLASFMGGSGASDIGLNTVLGGASFVPCVVVGVISIGLRSRCVRVKKSDFVRDVCSLLLVFVSLTVIVFIGKINIWGAMGYSSLYAVYVFLVCFWHQKGEDVEEEACFNCGIDLTAPILRVDEKGLMDQEKGDLEMDQNRASFRARLILRIMEMPLNLPRRLTIPVVSEEKWSKPFAVASVTLSPPLIAALWNSQMEKVNSKTSLLIYGVSFFLGTTLGFIVHSTTEKSSPPTKYLCPWLAGGFLMSVIWSYITAQELVGLLVSLGYIFKISPSILGLTVLAWGTSLGDLITNSTMALKGGEEGAQIAVSGCYAGPIFNTVVGLGLSLMSCSWKYYPETVMLSADPFLLETIGFSVVGLVWALVILPRNDMRLDGILGGGLLVAYLLSIFMRLLTQILGSSDTSSLTSIHLTEHLF